MKVIPVEFTYNTKNTCSKQIKFTIDKNEVITNVEFLGGGCPGNLQAIPKLVNGLTAKEIEEKVGGIICGNKGTSCCNELVKAINKAKEEIIQHI